MTESKHHAKAARAIHHLPRVAAKRSIAQEIGKEKLAKPKAHAALLSPKHGLTWEADEFVYYQKNSFWLIGIVVMLGGLALLFIALGDYLFSVACALAIVIFYQHGQIKPKRLPVELTAEGVKFRQRLYPYEKLKSFWLVEKPTATLYLETAAWSLPLTVLLANQPTAEVRSFLSRYLPEHPTATEQLADRVTRALRF